LGVGRKASNLAPEKKKPNTAKNAQLLKAGRMDNRRPKRVIRNRKENIYLGTRTGNRERKRGSNGTKLLSKPKLIKSCRAEEEEE